MLSWEPKGGALRINVRAKHPGCAWTGCWFNRGGHSPPLATASQMRGTCVSPSLDQGEGGLWPGVCSGLVRDAMAELQITNLELLRPA